MDDSGGKLFKLIENIIFLKKIPLFREVKTDDIRAIAEICSEISFNPGDVIVREGEVGDSMYVIKSGCVSVSKGTDKDERIELAKMGSGECFGDMAIFDAEVRSANVIADDFCTLLRIQSGDLMDVVNDMPGIGIEMIRIFVRRLRETNEKMEKIKENTGRENE